MKLLEDIISSLAADSPVHEVRRGLYWTAVRSSHCGLASAMAFQRSCSNEEGGGGASLTDFSARELSARSLSEDLSDWALRQLTHSLILMMKNVRM